jgi:hypothetical protein
MTGEPASDLDQVSGYARPRAPRVVATAGRVASCCIRVQLTATPTRSKIPDLQGIATQHAVGGLAEVLNQLGAELRQASASGEDPIIFGGADVELSLTLEATAGGGVKFWVINADADSSYTRGAKITVHVYPGGQESPWAWENDDSASRGCALALGGHQRSGPRNFQKLAGRQLPGSVAVTIGDVSAWV